MTNTSLSTEYEQLCLGRTANRNTGVMYGMVPLKRTPNFDTTKDWAILERDDEKEFSVHLALCDFANLPKVDDHVRTCFCPCDLVMAGGSATLDVTLGDYNRVTQYAPEVSEQLHNGFMASSGPIESPREDPQNVYLSVEGGLYGGCCGSPYIDRKNRVVAFHLYSGDDCLPIDTVIHSDFENTKSGSKKTKKGDDADTASSSGGYASMKQGLILAKLDSLVLTIRALGIFDLNRSVCTDKVEER